MQYYGTQLQSILLKKYYTIQFVLNEYYIIIINNYKQMYILLWLIKYLLWTSIIDTLLDWHNNICHILLDTQENLEKGFYWNEYTIINLYTFTIHACLHIYYKVTFIYKNYFESIDKVENLFC